MSTPNHDGPASNAVDLQQFHDIEAIKQLKARYCRHLDAKDWEAWRGVFTDDFVSDTAESGGRLIEGADAMVAYLRTQLGKPTQPTVHQVQAPEIELTTPTTARGIWALQDVVRVAPGVNLLGYGHYHETYAKIDGRWYIKTSKLTRLREDIFNPLFSFRVPVWLRNAAGAAVARKQQK
ncbi:nuclear transport factor 2 family protein [Aldersonia sp. NBC_00410]|uniref:nuclear transport factor 2 family protein n=1 Tax=Aldersonia sp. NBC_00410 TaxID=2975954 RepID=UPI0022552D7C|nr:nuclear transport factor 2 family protein [Aldersonia sp. NBC_00410]MCX5042351.1 nuclear transport factor 2 family protein [Aldersonia sp. NBC_00410]